MHNRINPLTYFFFESIGRSFFFSLWRFEMRESAFKKRFLAKVEERLSYLDLDFITPTETSRSLPDIFVIGPLFWAALEFKRSGDANHQPNQDWYIERFNEKGYGVFVEPNNEEEVLNDLERLFSS